MQYRLILSIIAKFQHSMQFEAGPWHCFGEEMLQKLIEIAPSLIGVHQSVASITGMPVFSGF